MVMSSPGAHHLHKCQNTTGFVSFENSDVSDFWGFNKFLLTFFKFFLETISHFFSFKSHCKLFHLASPSVKQHNGLSVK